MITRLTATGIIAGALFAYAVPSRAAEDFPATPIQHGAPRDLPGERLIPGVDLAVDAIDVATKPLLTPILALDAPAAPAAAPAAKHHARHHHLAASRHAWHSKRSASLSKAAPHHGKAGGHHKQAAVAKRSKKLS